MKTVQSDNIFEFIAQLHAADIHMQLAGEQLKISGARQQLSSDILEQIRDRKVDIINALKGYSYKKYSNIPLIEDQEYYNVSYAQRRLWIIHQLEEGKSAYNTLSISGFKGAPEPRMLEKAVQQLMDKHESLRTVFFSLNGEIKQRICNKGTLPSPVLYVHLEDADRQQTLLSDCLEEEASYVFDLEKGPLFRIKLIYCSNEEYMFCFNVHHIIADGWSMKLLLNEMQWLYEQNLTQQHSRWPQLPVQYRHYTAWQRQALQEMGAGSHRAYWNKQMDGDLPVLDLPTDYPRPAVRRYEGSSKEVWLDQELKNSLTAIGLEAGTNIFAVLVAALSGIFFRYTGQQDLMIGTPVSGRAHADLEQQVGLYVNTVVFRSRFSGENTFYELLRQVKQVVLDGLEHEQYPFDLLIEDLNIAGDRSRNPLFDLMIIYEKKEDENNINTSIALESQELLRSKVSMFDLTYDFQEKENGLQLSIVYNKELFGPRRIENMAAHFKQWLQAIITYPHIPLQELEYLSGEEEQVLLNGFNDTHRVYTPGLTLKHLLELQAKRTPDAVALVFKEERLTYAALDRAANQLARLLMQKGVTAETLVPVCLERSMEMVIAIIAILKAGAAYVPVDPLYPEERIRYILQDTGAKLVITDGAVPFMENIAGVEILNLIAEWSEVQSMPAENIDTGPEPRNLAYVIYTSGSTGRPKGVMIEHAAIVNRICWMQEYFRLQEGDRVLQKTTFCFDVSVWEFLWPLCTGARLVVAVPDGHRDNRYLKEVIEREAITTIHFVPSMLDVFLTDLESNGCSSLKRVICSGEALKSNHINSFREKLSHAGLYNLYGPTEAAIDVSCWHAPGHTPFSDLVPIGKPVANTALYVLDNKNKPQPLGAKGRLFIGGIQLARGYLNNRELTEKKFIEHPELGRLYDTGDLARWLWDGNLLFLGRNDDQVKIRAYRIELEEVTAAVIKYKGIKDGVVVACQVNGDNILAAYVIWAGQPDEEGVRMYLHSCLPLYMHPAVYVGLNDLPLTASGKIDKKRLPPLPELLPGLDYVPPENEMEQKMTEIWEEVFYREKIGVSDDFFALGGHSIKAIRMISLIYKAFGIQTTLNKIFTNTTIRALCNELKKQDPQYNSPAEINGHTFRLEAGNETFYEVTGGQQYWVNMYHDKEYKEHDKRHGLMSLILEINGDFNIGSFRKAVQFLIERHESLRATFRFLDGKCVMKILDQAAFCHFPEYSEAAQENILDETAEDFIYFKDHRFDFEQGPLFLVRVLKTGNDKHIVSIRIHHVISDTWTVEIMGRDLFTAYNAYEQQQLPQLPPLPYQFKEYLSFVLAYERANWQSHDAYWRQRYKTLPDELIIPAEQKERSAGFSKRIVHTLNFPVPRHLYEQLKMYAGRFSTSLFVVLQAAFKSYLHHKTGQLDIVIGADVHGRDHAGLQNQIGSYSRAVLVRTVFEEQDDFAAQVFKVKQANLEMMQYTAASLLGYLLELTPPGVDLRTTVWKVNLKYDDTTGYQITDQVFNELTTSFDIKLLPDPANSIMLTPFDMYVGFVVTDEGLTIIVEYDSSLYTSASISLMINDFIAYIQGL